MKKKSLWGVVAAGWAAFLVLLVAGCGGGGGAGGGGSVGGGGGGLPGGGGGGGTTCGAYFAPGSPSLSNASAANASVTMKLADSGFNGGSTVINYIVTASAPAATSPIQVTVPYTGASTYTVTVNGLTNGWQYNFTAVANNCLGASNSSFPIYATPATIPGAPTITSVVSGNTTATLSFTPPASDGGSPIQTYTVTSLTPTSAVVATGLYSPITVYGLSNGTTYTFSMTATNAMGTGPASPATSAVTPSTVPGAPTNVSAAAGNQSATVSFVAPANNGGAAIGGYTVIASGATATTATGTSSPIVIGGLTNNTTYTFTVTANNVDGSSAQSLPSNPVIPIANMGPYYVNPASGSDLNPGTSGQPFKTLTFALAVASGVGATNTINAASGTYSTATGETWPLTMVNNVNLVGAGSANSVISGDATGTAYWVPYGNSSYPITAAVLVPANATTTVSGFKLTMAASAPYWTTQVAIVDNAASATFATDVIQPAVGGVDALGVYGASQAQIYSSTISGTCGFDGGLLVQSEPAGNPTVYARGNTFTDTCNAAVFVIGPALSAGGPNVDLGTAASPGNNFITGPLVCSTSAQVVCSAVGLDIAGDPVPVAASGNTWHKNTQGASSFGQYTVGGPLVSTATAVKAGNNYAIGADLINGTVPSAGIQF